MKRAGQEDHQRPGPAGHLHGGHRPGHLGARGDHRQPLLRRQPRLPGGVRRRDRGGRGRRRARRGGEGRLGHRRGGRRAHAGPGLVHRRRRDVDQRRDQRADPLPQPGRAALHLPERGHRRRPAAAGRRHHPARPHAGRPRPHGAVQRLQAAVPGAVAQRHQPAVLRDRAGLPGRGRHPRGTAGPHRLGHPDPRLARRGDRRPHRQPQPGAGAPRRPRPAARTPDPQLPRPDERAEVRPPGDLVVARRGVRAVRGDRRPRVRHPQALRRATSRGCATSRATSTPTRRSSTGPCRCCPSSWRRWGGPPIYGSWFNFYLCEFQGRVKLPAGVELSRHLRDRVVRGATLG